MLYIVFFFIYYYYFFYLYIYFFCSYYFNKPSFFFFPFVITVTHEIFPTDNHRFPALGILSSISTLLPLFFFLSFFPLFLSLFFHLPSNEIPWPHAFYTPFLFISIPVYCHSLPLFPIPSFSLSPSSIFLTCHSPSFVSPLCRFSLIHFLSPLLLFHILFHGSQLSPPFPSIRGFPILL